MAVKRPGTKARAKVSARAGQKKRGEALENVAARFASFRPAREVFQVVRAVPTIFSQFDHATKVGGLPIERFMLVHGPSSHGKTSFALGLLRSFLERGHFGMLIDAEHTTPITWLRTLLGPHADSDRFFGYKPESYEQTVDDVREFLCTVAKMRETGKVHAETSALIVLDSLRKLNPRNLLKKLVAGAEKHGVDGMGGRAAQIKAALNAAWLDELIPLLARTGTAMLVITRETDDVELGPGGYKIGGGKAPLYESSLAMRVERASWIYEAASRDDDGNRQPAIGERHRVTIHKSKIAKRDDKYQVAHFSTSNGTVTPEGFEPARDLLELGEKFGVVEVAGSWVKFDGHRWQGKMSAVKKLTEDAETLAALDTAVRAKFAEHAPQEHDADGVVE